VITSTNVSPCFITVSIPRCWSRPVDLPALSTDLYDRLRDDIRLRGIQIPLLVDNTTGEVIDGKLRKLIAAEFGIRDVPTIYVSCLNREERSDLRLAVNLYRRHLSRAQMRELIAWSLRCHPEASDRRIAGQTGASHPTVARVRREMVAGGTIYHLPSRNGQDGRKYPVAKPAAFACSASEGRRARALLDRLGDDAPHRTISIRVLHKLANRKDRTDLSTSPAARLPARIKIECCEFKDLAVPDGSVDLIFTDPPWGKQGRRLMAEFAAWSAPKLRPDGGLMLIYSGHAGLLEVGNALSKRLTYLWTFACHNGAKGTHTQHDLGIRSCWRPMLWFSRGRYRAGRVFDDVILSTERDKSYHEHQQPLGEALFYIKALSRPKATICDPFLGSGTTACAVARLGQGRRFWGSEIDAETCRVARSRVAQELTAAVPMKAAMSR
jgi:site-specific DNA-methyltransferase (adenine-specific)